MLLSIEILFPKCYNKYRKKHRIVQPIKYYGGKIMSIQEISQQLNKNITQSTSETTCTIAPWFESAFEAFKTQQQNEKLNKLEEENKILTKAVELLQQTQVPKKKKQPIKEKSTSLFTTHEIPKPKAQAADSIKTLDEVDMLFQHFLQRKQYRNYALLVTGMSTAYRIGDLLRLTYADFFKDDDIFRFEFDMFEEKSSKRRKMEITKPIQDAISLYVSNSKIDFKNERDLPIFRSAKCKKEAIKRESFHKILKTACEIELNLPYNAGTHLMRKTWAYWYLQLHKGDMSALSTLQDILGHSSEKITLRYCGISKEENRQNNRDVSNLWQGLMEKQGLSDD